MSAAAICQRLIWKEARESALMVSFGVIAPAAVLIVIQRKMIDLQWMIIVLLMTTVLGAFLWASEKAGAKRNRNDFEDAYLVMPKTVDWLASYVFPALIAFGIGAWMGYALSAAPGWSESHWSRTQQWTVLSSGLCLLSGFVVCYAASRAFGFLAGAIIGTVWLIYPATRLIIPASQGIPDPGPTMVAFMTRAAIGAVLGSASLLLTSRSPLYPKLQFVPLTLAVATGFAPSLHGSVPFANKLEPSYTNYGVISQSSPDGSLVIEPSGKSASMLVSLRLMNWPSMRSHNRSFHQAVQPIALTGNAAYLAQQSIGDDDVKVLTWDASTGKLSRRAKINAGANAILDCQPGAASPDGRYLIFFLGTKIGPGRDLWIVNTATGSHRVLLPNTNKRNLRAQWTDNCALLSCGKIMRVRLSDLTCSEVEIPTPSEAQR